jgi:hypothetical protein
MRATRNAQRATEISAPSLQLEAQVRLPRVHLGLGRRGGLVPAL